MAGNERIGLLDRRGERAHVARSGFSRCAEEEQHDASELSALFDADPRPKLYAGRAVILGARRGTTLTCAATYDARRTRQCRFPARATTQALALPRPLTART
jgi:hypothetical protein